MPHQIPEDLKLAQGGDIEAFGRLFDELSPRISKYLALRIQREAAEDLLHDVFLETWKSLPRYQIREDAKFSTWVFAITKNLLISQYRKRRLTADLEEVEIAVFEDEDAKVTAHQVREAINQLPLKEQEALSLSLLDGFTYTEVAETMGLQENYVRQLVFRAKKHLQKKFEE
jgi:RNA polymerase sigma-70 factor (ECF subfamily)